MPSFLKANNSNISCKRCGEIHKFWTKGCIAIEFTEDEKEWYGFFYDEWIELTGSYGIPTVSLMSGKYVKQMASAKSRPKRESSYFRLGTSLSISKI